MFERSGQCNDDEEGEEDESGEDEQQTNERVTSYKKWADSNTYFLENISKRSLSLPNSGICYSCETGHRPVVFSMY